MVAALQDNPIDPVTQLRKCCKIGLRAMSRASEGAPIILKGEKNILVRVQEEDIVRGKGRRTKLHRVMLTGEGQHYTNIGWVVDGDAKKCMSCASKFGMFIWRHHCRLCGDAVCGSCSSKRVNLEEKYRLGEGEAGSRVCTACFVHKYECSSADLNTDINAKANGGKQSAQDHRENQENAGINGSRAGVAASSAAAGVGTNAKLSNTRPILSERPAIVASSEPDERSAFSPEVTGVAIPAGDLEAPTPDPKSVPTVGAVAVSRSRTSSISSNTSTTNITTNPEIIPKGILKMPQAAPALIIPQEVQVQPVELLPSCQSPMSALLDGLNGRWDRSDDGISTPGSVTSMMNYSATNTAVTTPERMHGGPGSLAAVTPTTQAGEKYFYTPSHTNTCSDASYMMAGSASVLRREQLAAHNAKLNIEVCREVDATSDMMYSPLQSSPASSSMVTLTPSPLPNTQSHAL